MCNCNKKRMSLQNKADNAYKNMVKVRLKENKPMLINGNITGQTYIFKNKGDVNWVDKRDLDELKRYKDLVLVY